MKLFLIFIFLLNFLFLVNIRAGDDFNWSWEDESEKISTQDNHISEADRSESFDWSWTNSDHGSLDAEDTHTKPVNHAIAGINVEDYNQLLKQNIELRKKIEAELKEKDKTKKENEKRARELKDMERRLSQFVTLIDTLKKEKALSAGNPDKTMDLEVKLAKADDEKAKLAIKVVALQKRINDLKSTRFKPTALPDNKIQQGSDLFQQVKNENTLLKKKLLKIEEAKEKALKEYKTILKEKKEAKSDVKVAKTRQKETEKRLGELKHENKKAKQSIKKLLKQLPDLEGTLVTLKTDLKNKDIALTTKEKELEMLKLELQRREHRLIKAERMATLLEKARAEVTQLSDKEKRDMHYNMASVYDKEGHYKEAEIEYLRALRLDPTDAGVHYNLGILYDDKLGDKRKATMHYRKYVKLNPYADDVDTVKGWLLKIDMDSHK